MKKQKRVKNDLPQIKTPVEEPKSPAHDQLVSLEIALDKADEVFPRGIFGPPGKPTLTWGKA